METIVLIAVGIILAGMAAVMTMLFDDDSRNSHSHYANATPVVARHAAAGDPLLALGVYTLVGLLAVVAVIGGGFLIKWLMTMAYETIETRAAARKRDEIKSLQARDPVAIARLAAPDLLADVETAVDRISRLRSLDPLAASQETADALAMADGSLRETLSHYVRTAGSATDQEREAIARTALGAVIDVGRIADEARHAAVIRMGEDVETNARYIASRASRDGLAPLA